MDALPNTSVPVPFDSTEIGDIWACAAERGLTIEELIRQAVLADLAR